MKLRPKKIRITNPSKIVFIVGQNPGNKQGEDEVFYPSRTGNLIDEVISNKDNVYLTNICNYQDLTPSNILKGLADLLNDIENLKPYKIILLGRVAKVNFERKVMKYIDESIYVVYAHHPSFVLRFNKGKELYITNLRKEL
jgi:uracil-DNA glycosylase family 4